MRRRSETRRAVALSDEPTWYKDAIIYEVRTRSYFDSNDDGIGDLRGLAGKLDYLQDLGVTALWLLPFYPSPGRDDGYDISDYTDVHPDVGTLADLEFFLDEAHRRGLRVITELVLNHTSDQHPWFQRSRRAPPGSPERDFYVWNDTPDRYREARIIFRDFEPSNWSWDAEAKAYYWHRFYAHQPDLNFENPAVHDALLSVVDFWFGKGVDGLRLDAVPYLYEEEGTNCENLAKTHAFLKKLRAHVDARFKNRMLLAEANQWPEDAAAYFGAGDECHMNFHFPLMPRLFMAIHQEDRLPIVDIFAQTPATDGTCQWALFLRNHDELTLEMVSDEERDYMYRAYADQAAMRINLGIRRRLAPLVGNNRRKVELLNALLFSLPGTPVLYYGDEIGMGDNIYLGDRDGVRTPMQWSLDRNAGFSRANPQRLILPVVIDPEYHYESLNVENQQQNPTSLLWWTKRLIAIRKRFAAFGRGSIEFLSPSNPRVLAHVRAYRDERVLIVANLSRFAQYVELDLSKYKGFVLTEPFGETVFPAVGDVPYVITLGPHGFYWFSLDAPGKGADVLSIPPPESVPCVSVEALLGSKDFEETIVAFLETRSWMAGRPAALRGVRVDEAIRIGTGSDSLWIMILRVEYADGDWETCVVPIALVPEDHPVRPDCVLVHVEVTGGPASFKGTLVDAFDEPSSSHAVLAAISSGAKGHGKNGEIAVSVIRDGAISADVSDLEAWKLGRERHDTTVRYGDRFVVRLFRHLDDGVTPELEVGRYLARRGVEISPPLYAALELRRPRVEPLTLALVQAFVPHVASGWAVTSNELSQYFDRVLARTPSESHPPPVPGRSPFALVGVEPPPVVSAMIGSYLETAAQLGLRVAQLHLALGAPTTDRAFAPEPYTALDRRSKYQSLRNLAGRVLRLLRDRLQDLSPPIREEALRALSNEASLLRCFEPLLRGKMEALRIRLHGRLHLGHVLYTGGDFIFTDLGGARDRSLAERRRKRSPLRDLASMVWSFESAALKFLLDPAHVRESDLEAARPWAFHWAAWVSASFLAAYLQGVDGAPFAFREREPAGVLFAAFWAERAFQSLKLQLEDRSEDVLIALVGLNYIASRDEG
jgi:maltose alpha-D-glucosyltransferase/alpha-amylase